MVPERQEDWVRQASYLKLDSPQPDGRGPILRGYSGSASNGNTIVVCTGPCYAYPKVSSILNSPRTKVWTSRSQVRTRTPQNRNYRYQHHSPLLHPLACFPLGILLDQCSPRVHHLKHPKHSDTTVVTSLAHLSHKWEVYNELLPPSMEEQNLYHCHSRRRRTAQPLRNVSPWDLVRTARSAGLA